MAQQEINVGNSPNDGQGNPIRTAFIKCNDNFDELYARAQPNPPVSLTGSPGDEAGFYASDSNYFYYCFDNYDGVSTIWAQIAQIGNISVSAISSGTSNVEISNLNGNATISIAGTSNVVVVSSAGQFVSGTVSATGNVTGAYFLGNGSQLTGLPETYNNANVTSLLAAFGSNSISSTGTVTAGNITGENLLTNNIISATGNITTSGFFLGNFIGNIVANITNIPGPGGAVVFNDGSGNAAATAGLIFDNSSPNVLTVQGSYSATGNITGNNINGTSIIGPLTTAAQPNITSVGTLSSLSVSGNVQGGNLRTAGQISATGSISSAGNVVSGNLRVNNNASIGGNIAANRITGSIISTSGSITGGNITASGVLEVTGNVTGGNITTDGIVSTTGNIIGNNISAGGIVSTTGNITTAANITGGNITGNNILTGGIVSATGNITGGNLRVGNLTISPDTISSSSQNITIGYPDNIGNVIISGNLQVLGNTTTINSNVVSTNDLTVNYANNAINSAAANGGGVEVGPIGSPYITWLYNNVANTWTSSGGISVVGTITGGDIITPGVITVNSGDAATAIVNGGSNATGNIGSSSNYFNTVFAKATSAQYADLAENYVADAEYAPGTVVIFGGTQEITVTDQAGDERVAGAVSTKPAYLMNSGESGIAVALRGRVPVNVIGPVIKGDSLVTSTEPGYAISVGRDRSYGQAVFAKALETNIEEGKKMITAVVL